MFELPSAFIEPVETATPATQPEIAACIFVNAIDVSAFFNGVPVFQAGNIMGDLSRLSIQSIQRTRGEPYPQNTLGISVNCSDPAGRETIRISGAMHITAELSLLEIENIKPSLLSSHPQHAAPVQIHRDHSVIVEAIRVALIVLKKVREMFCAPVKVIEAQTRWHPKSVSSIIEKLAINQADSTGANRVGRESLCLAIIFDEPDDRGIGQYPKIADLVFSHVIRAQAIPGRRRASKLSCLYV